MDANGCVNGGSTTAFSGSKGCVEWTGTKTACGYGRKTTEGKRALVHRMMFERYWGFLPKVVQHECDNPACMNPLHLTDGTRASNLQDMARKGRQWCQKLSMDDVHEIRDFLASGLHTQAEIGNMFGVSRGAVSDIKYGRTWAHLPNKGELKCT